MPRAIGAGSGQRDMRDGPRCGVTGHRSPAELTSVSSWLPTEARCPPPATTMYTTSSNSIEDGHWGMPLGGTIVPLSTEDTSLTIMPTSQGALAVACGASSLCGPRHPVMR